MALVTTFTCSGCGNEVHELVLPSRRCSSCREDDAKAATKKRRMDLAALKGMTIEERLERIEAELYDTDARARLHSLESSNITY